MKAVVSVVRPTATFHKTLNVSRRFSSARSVAPNAPMPEASVGVAIPRKIDPRTARMRPTGGRIARNVSRTSRPEKGTTYLGFRREAGFSATTMMT